MNLFNDILGWQIVPSHRDKYVYATAGAIVGGVVFGLTASWYLAIWWDAIAALTCWGTVKIAAPIGGYITSAFSYAFRFLRS